MAVTDGGSSDIRTGYLALATHDIECRIVQFARRAVPEPPPVSRSADEEDHDERRLEADAAIERSSRLRACLEPLRTGRPHDTRERRGIHEEMLDEHIDECLAAARPAKRWDATDNEPRRVPGSSRSFTRRVTPRRRRAAPSSTSGTCWSTRSATPTASSRRWPTPVLQRVADARGVLGFDVSAYKANTAVGRMFAELAQTFAAEVNVADARTH